MTIFDPLHQYSYEYQFRSAVEYVGPAPGVPLFGAISAIGLVAQVSTGGCSTRQACGVSGAGVKNNMAVTQDQPQQHAPSSGGFGTGISEAGKAGDAGAAGLSMPYTTEQCRHSYTMGQGQLSFTTSRWERFSAEEKLRKKKV